MRILKLLNIKLYIPRKNLFRVLIKNEKVNFIFVLACIKIVKIDNTIGLLFRDSWESFGLVRRILVWLGEFRVS